jgi:hypothetical protein
MRQNITPVMLEYLDEKFSTKLTGTFTRNDGTSFEYAYDVCPLDDEFGVTMSNVSIKMIEDENDYAGSIELRLIRTHSPDGTPITENATTIMGSVSVDGPQLAFDWTTSDHAYGVKAAEISHSSNRGSVADMRRQMAMIEIAIELAELWTEFTRPTLEKLAAEQTAKYEQSRREEAARREKLAAAKRRLLEVAQSRDVRVTLPGKKTPLVGRLEEGTGRFLELHVSWKKEPVKFTLDNIEKFEMRAANGRFQEVEV